jgi:opacity protein-like surface antigen
MLSVKIVLSAVVAAMISTAAYAADLPQPNYPPPPEPSGGWYLRGDIGVAVSETLSLNFLQNPLNTSNFAFLHHDIGNTVFYNLGVGYEVNNWLRFDVTGEYRSKTDFDAFGIYTFGGGTFGDSYHGFLKSWLFLGNGYVDLGTWDCITPFVGAGVGAAYNTMADLTDTGLGTSGTGIGRDSSKWNPAWALYAGLDYSVTPDFKVELTYRYLNYGSVTDTIDCTGGCNPDSYKFGNLTSQDVMLGVRWLLQPEQVPVMPLSTRG